jgi:LuxR family glucitol operon transcriptional activator
VTVSVQRLTLFALISAFESDARSLIGTSLLPNHTYAELFGDLPAAQALERMKLSADLVVDDQDGVALLDFFDVGDYIKCLHKHNNEISKGTQGLLKTKARMLEAIVPIRNRVMHGRPLDFDDLPAMKSISQILKDSDTFYWSETREVLRQLRADPSYALRYEDGYTVENIDKIFHNLPSPDFDDTGFVGRNEQIQRLKKALASNYPAITILGDGGLGKTSLALKVLYDTMDELSERFDAIIWTTAKTSLLTPNEIVQIEGAIKDSLGIFQNAATVIGAAITDEPLGAVKQ